METSPGSRSTVRTRILIVEDHVTLREMLADFISQKPEFEVVGQADTLDEALRLARATQPDVVILDWLFPGGGGEAFLREMRPSRLHSFVLVLTGNACEEAVRTALTAGARGFYEKGSSLDEFFTALRTVAAGGAYFGPVASEIVERLLGSKSAVPPMAEVAVCSANESMAEHAGLELAAAPAV